EGGQFRPTSSERRPEIYETFRFIFDSNNLRAIFRQRTLPTQWLAGITNRSSVINQPMRKIRPNFAWKNLFDFFFDFDRIFSFGQTQSMSQSKHVSINDHTWNSKSIS